MREIKARWSDDRPCTGESFGQRRDAALRLGGKPAIDPTESDPGLSPRPFRATPLPQLPAG
jgi:hypothetical protein